MNGWRSSLLGLLLSLACGELEASTLVIRDSIGPDSSLTDGMPGASTFHSGLNWNTPGLIVDVPVDGKLSQASFVIFARDKFLNPENDLGDIYGFPMEFQVWSDGIQGGADSFAQNASCEPVAGHIEVDVNTPTTSFITVTPFGHTGPIDDPNMFTTFLVTIDLSSFNIELQGGRQYVMGIINNQNEFPTDGGFFRVSASRATGSEDLYQDTESTEFPGYVKTQLGFTFEQYGGAFSMAPLLPGDYDFDGDVDTFDYDNWRETFGSTTNLMADGNDDGAVNAADYVFWRKHLPTTASGASLDAAVPEPGGLAMVVFGLVLCVLRRRKLRKVAGQLGTDQE